MEYDPDPENAVTKCSVTYDNNFHGRWEDGERYDKAESADFWGPYEPTDNIKSDTCNGISLEVDEQNQVILGI